VLYQAKPKCVGGGSAAVLWSSPSGGTVLGAVGYTDGPSGAGHSAIVLYRHGAVTTINWPGAVSLLLANETAFSPAAPDAVLDRPWYGAHEYGRRAREARHGRGARRGCTLQR
jgi:hypothetical protein